MSSSVDSPIQAGIVPTQADTETKTVRNNSTARNDEQDVRLGTHSFPSHVDSQSDYAELRVRTAHSTHDGTNGTPPWYNEDVKRKYQVRGIKMANFTEHVFVELGNFQDVEIEAIKRQMEGKSYMHFEVASSNWAGNHTLIVRTHRPDTSEQELTEMFLHCALSALWQMNR